ncbi:LOW QUALITY PROTEIN: hypothetical protein U0070_013664, partial [Myodes glareolus]
MLLIRFPISSLAPITSLLIPATSIKGVFWSSSMTIDIQPLLQLIQLLVLLLTKVSDTLIVTAIGMLLLGDQILYPGDPEVSQSLGTGSSQDSGLQCTLHSISPPGLVLHVIPATAELCSIPRIPSVYPKPTLDTDVETQELRKKTGVAGAGEQGAPSLIMGRQKTYGQVTWHLKPKNYQERTLEDGGGELWEVTHMHRITRAAAWCWSGHRRKKAADLHTAKRPGRNMGSELPLKAAFAEGSEKFSLEWGKRLDPSAGVNRADWDRAKKPFRLLLERARELIIKLLVSTSLLGMVIGPRDFERAVSLLLELSVCKYFLETGGRFPASKDVKLASEEISILIKPDQYFLDFMYYVNEGLYEQAHVKPLPQKSLKSNEQYYLFRIWGPTYDGLDMTVGTVTYLKCMWVIGCSDKWLLFTLLMDSEAHTLLYGDVMTNMDLGSEYVKWKSRIPVYYPW